MASSARKNFLFELDVVEDWPPVGAEGLPFEKTADGWRLLIPPLFVKGLSVGDVLAIKQRAGTVTSWKHVTKSGNTTIWLLSLEAAAEEKVDALLAQLNALGCQTVALRKWSSYSISVPAALSIETIDAILAERNEEEIAVAYPSLRHATGETAEPEARIWLRPITTDSFFVKKLVVKGQKLLASLDAQIARERPVGKAVFKLTHATTKAFNRLAILLFLAGSELETVAREAIASDIEYILEKHGYDVSLEEALGPRTW